MVHERIRRVAATATLRPFEEHDLSAVLTIEQLSSLSPWTREAFLSEQKHPSSQLTVAEVQNRVVGYLCFWLVADEGQIANIAVHPLYRRLGIGRQLVQSGLSYAQQQGARSVTLEVRASNMPAIALYEEFGFHAISVRRRYYPNGEDALLMICDLL